MTRSQPDRRKIRERAQRARRRALERGRTWCGACGGTGVHKRDVLGDADEGSWPCRSCAATGDLKVAYAKAAGRSHPTRPAA